MARRFRLSARAAGAALLLAAGAASAQTFSLEGAVIDSRNAANLGVIAERGAIADLFKAQKAMTFGVLRAAGIPLDSLPPEVRARIERFQTTNLEAFRAFSQGLDLKDQGRFAEAKVQFARAAALDPGFALAVEQQQAMPDVNLGSGVQARAVVAAAAGQAVDRGKQSYAIDLAHAVAALQAGQTVVVAAAEPAPSGGDSSSAYTVNPAGSSSQFVPNEVAGVSFSYTAGGLPIGLAVSSEWTADKFVLRDNALEAIGSAGGFQAQRNGATQVVVGNAALADGSQVYWGQWLSAPGASATVTLASALVTAPALGPVDWMMGTATSQMPTTGSAVFNPVGGTLAQASGSLAVDFVTRQVELRNLGFTIGSLVFSGLNGATSYDPRILSGGFQGNYSSGACTGCAGFTPLSSSFGGNFVGRNADGAILSTILLTGSGSVSGLQLFGR